MNAGLRPHHRIHCIVAGALVAAVFVYALHAELLRRQPAPPPMGEDLMHLLRTVFAGISVTCGIAAFVVRGILLRKTDGEPAEARIRKYRVAVIVAGALAEAPAIFGLSLFHLSRDRSDFYVPAAGALVLLIVLFPDPGRFQAFVVGRNR